MSTQNGTDIITKVHCGENWKPLKVFINSEQKNETEVWTYSYRILTINYSLPTNENTLDTHIVMCMSKSDLNCDGVVDEIDVITAAKAFGSTPLDSNWKQAADLNDDDVVDIFDIVSFANEFGKTV